VLAYPQDAHHRNARESARAAFHASAHHQHANELKRYLWQMSSGRHDYVRFLYILLFFSTSPLFPYHPQGRESFDLTQYTMLTFCVEFNHQMYVTVAYTTHLT
jgi:hypothetical protein